MRITKIIKVILCVIIGALLFGLIVEHLWNWLMPTLFSLRTIDFKQAIGLVVLSKLLFGGFHRHGGGGGRRWKQKMQQRWAGMTPEERERFRAGMRNRHNCGWPPRREEPTV